MLSTSRLLLLLLATGLFSACSGPAETGGKSSTDGADTEQTPAGIDAPPAGIDSQPAPGQTSEQPGQIAAQDADAKPTERVKELSTGYDPETEKDLPAKDNVLGRWLFVLTQPGQGQDMHLFLLDIVKSEDGGFDGRLLGKAPQIIPATSKVAEAEVTEKTVHFVFDLGGQQLDFKGQLDGGLIRGNLVPVGGAACGPARMVPTEIADFSQHNPIHPTLGREDAIEIRQAEDQVAATREFARKHPDSPLVPMLYAPLFATAATEGLDEQTVDQLAAELLKYSQRWGERQVQFAQLNIALGLSMGGYADDVSTRYLDAADQNITDEYLLPMKEYIESGREQVRLTQARKELESDDAGVREAAFNTLQELHDEQPFNAELTLALADYAADQNLTDQAIAWFAELAALPNMEQIVQAVQSGKGDESTPLPSERLATLWKEKHGSTDGLDDYIQEVYAEGIDRFAREPVTEPRAENARTTLIELFTGATCPPCVAADVATGGLEATYPSSVIVLRYHMHIPGSDPLANPHTEARFHNYGLQGTPTVLMNGSTALQVAGGINSAVAAYESMRDVIDGQSDQTTELRLPITATAEGSRIQLDVRAEGLEELSDSLRLRVALAEKEIWFPASNGIRRHDMVVRVFVGGPEGIPPEDGKLQYIGSPDIAEIKRDLSAYLQEYEDSRGRLPAKPLDFANLEVVAWVQDEATGEILNASAVPVEGALDLPPITEAVKPDAEASEPAKDEPEQAPKPPELKAQAPAQDNQPTQPEPAPEDNP